MKARRGGKQINFYVSALYGASLVGAVIAASPVAHADPRPRVVELFTSQGCGSCPPADALLGELAHRNDVHVDYWNNLGWMDHISSAAATERQTVYGRAMNLDSIYTPQMVIDGTSDVVGSRRGAVLALLQGMRDGVGVKASRDGDTFVVEIGSTRDGAATQSGDVMLVAYTETAETKVPRGENAGRTLREYNIVRGFWKLGTWTGASETLRFDANKLPVDATRIALLVQAPGQGAIIGAAAQPIR
jgi:hypothetical protein